MQTVAMRYVIQHKDKEQNEYADQFGGAVYPVGFVMNPSLPHLGCSPDRRVNDPSENDPRGLVEIKCSPSDYLSELNYLKHNGRTGACSLKKTWILLSNHGLYWCDRLFLVAFLSFAAVSSTVK